MKIIFGVLIFAFLFFASISSANAQVVINEFSPRDEWVELYNIGTVAVDITGWTLKDAVNPPKILSGTIDSYPNGYFIYENSGNWLNNDTDSITLTRGDGSTHTILYGQSGGVCKPDNNTQAIASFSDGQASQDKFDRFSTATKGKTNSGGVLNPCPTPTPDPTATPTSTPTKTPSPTPTPTKTPSPTPKPSPTKTPSPKPQPTADRPLDETSEPAVLTASTESPEPSATPELQSDESPKFPILAIPLIVGGLGFVGVAAYPFLKGRARINSD